MDKRRVIVQTVIKYLSCAGKHLYQSLVFQLSGRVPPAALTGFFLRYKARD